HPLISALRRHKAGTVLITLQIALTLAIVCNSLFLISGRIEKIQRSSGLNESDLLMVATTHTGIKTATVADKARLEASIAGDLAALRQLPDVAEAYETNSLPLSNIAWSLHLRQKSDGGGGPNTGFFDADPNTLATLGVHLIAGRNFRYDEITGRDLLGVVDPSVIIVSKHLADDLFPNGDALGKQVYFSSTTVPSTIVGIIDRMQTGHAQSVLPSRAWNSTLVPSHLLEPSRYYVVRSKPGRLAAAMKSVPAALYAQDPQRVIPDGSGEDAGVRSFAQIREQAYQSDRVLAVLMSVISVILLVVTAAGIVGLSSFWVGQRRKQIGVRRALGATRADILRYFHAENLVISAAGVVIGSILAIGMNLWMVTQFEMDHLPELYVCIGAVVLLLLGQGAVLAPALRASRVSPVEATRSV
ncbi:MAG: ABC transporter permease, partial [Pseudomonadota bacterium]|nr:ABC transporter permease [Pseudomonadota bacterium]